MRKTKIVCTIGPASESSETIHALLEAGMDVARLNMSHGTREEHKERIRKLRTIAGELGKVMALMLDTRGPEVRIKTFKQGSVQLKQDDSFILTTAEVEGDNGIVAVSYPHLHAEVTAGNRILLDDGLLALEVTAVKGQNIICRVVTGGELSDRKGINIPGVSLNLPPLSDQDLEDIRFGAELGIDFVAASFVRKPADVIRIKEVLEELGSQAKIIAKIESQEGVNNIDSILELADGIMVARGDLGVEIPVEDVPLVQKQLIEKCNRAGKPVIIATQMLDSMSRNPRPTRAEASDVANAILDGTDAVMLSGETAAGKYPVESVRTMAKIALRTEDSLIYSTLAEHEPAMMEQSVTDAISFATCHTAEILKVAAIITSTESGHTARMVSKYRPRAPVIAVTPYERVANQLALTWGVIPLPAPPMNSTDDMFESAVNASLKAGYIKKGDMVVITAGIPVGVSGATNLLRVHTVGDIILKGTGIGRRAVTGSVFRARTAEEAGQIVKGQVLVVKATDSEYLPALEKAGGLVTEEGGLTSHAAIVGLSLGIPVVVGARDALEILEEGETITIDSTRGLIYRGKATIL
ncbi:MAG TPA: pyruvate kinase [Firmicutes bacterium]|nr:pyruvate kinase [Bacillota bacterium]